MWFHHVISLSIFFGEAGRYRRQHALQREQRELRRPLRLTLAQVKPGDENPDGDDARKGARGGHCAN